MTSDSALNTLENSIQQVLANFKAQKTGNLFVICVPKELTPLIQFQSHSYGKSCDCHSEDDEFKILKNLLTNDEW